MKKLLAPAALALVLGMTVVPVGAQAAGCLKGAAVGGIAGHMAGHHAVLGAAAGCAVGHHEAAKRMREREHAEHNDPVNDNTNR